MNAKRDIVVVGTSAGGFAALRQVLAGLPADFPAAVLIVIHLHPRHVSVLPELLSKACPLPVAFAQNGEAIVNGRVYFAPPDRHLSVRAGYVEISRGPKENGHRPAVDTLFRSASGVYGPRVIGVVMTGYLNCGTAGLVSVKARGGLAIVQDPSEAEAPDMPRSARDHVDIDHVVSLGELAPLLGHLVREDAGERPDHLRRGVPQMEGTVLGGDAELVCPSCQGKLTTSEVAGFSLYRCHVGHAFSLESLSAEQADEVERALWASVRALEEGGALSHRLASATTGAMRERFLVKENGQRNHADVIRRIILDGNLLSPAEPLLAAADTTHEVSAPQSGPRSLKSLAASDRKTAVKRTG